MKTTLITVALFCISFSLTAQNRKPGPTEYETLGKEFISLKADEQRVASVSNYAFTREAAVFHLLEGKLYLVQPLNGKVRAALFVGKGVFSFTPPVSIEQELLYQFAQRKSINEPFTSALFVFGDATVTEWERTLNFIPQEVRGSVNSDITSGLEYLYDSKSQTMTYEFAKTFIEQRENELFSATLETNSLGKLFYEIDPFIEEQVQLAQVSRSSILRSLEYRLICQFRSAGEPVCTPAERGERRHGYTVVQNTIECTISSPATIFGEYFRFAAVASIQLRAVREPSRWLLFYLDGNLRVDSVRSNGMPARFFQGEESSEIWVECDTPLTTAETKTITIYYRGDILRKLDARLELGNSVYWYPRQTSWGRQLFDVTFRYPSEYSLIAVGTMVHQSEEEDVTTTQWKTAEPVRGYTFNMGKFKERVIDEDDVPQINVLFTGAADAWISEEVADDMLNAVRLFQQLYGPSPAKALYASETPYFHGEAHLGLIHFSGLTFLKDFVAGSSSAMLRFRAHEVAHQWWGIGVDTRSYHDVWLGEGLAEYSGLLYLQAATKDNEVFFEELEKFKRNIMETTPKERSPISLGHRNKDYTVQIYQKGAWVLHMLRMMAVELRTMNEEVFNSILSTYYTRFLNKHATTQDFQRIVEEKTGREMSWFFRQWIDGTEIPKYTFAYNTEETPDGKYKVRCRVSQENVPDDFQAYVTIRINFSGDRFARTRVFVKGKVSEFELPILPAEPEEIIFNDMESVLCEVSQTGW